MQRWTLILILPFLALIAMVAALGSEPTRAEVEGLAPAIADTDGIAAFDIVYDVLMHPRCMNCHPSANAPLQGDLSRPHMMNVQRGPSNKGNPGMECSTCHHAQAVEGLGMPPGVSSNNWHLAPVEMAFQGKSKTDIALMLKDKERSHMDGAALIRHVEHDALVGWGWNPGEGRTAVPTSREDFVNAFKKWVEAGMPVPESGNK